MKLKVIIPFLLLCSISVFGQNGSDSTVIDTLSYRDVPIYTESGKEVNIEEIETYADKFIPRKASLYAAILPGSGQIYNKKYWKLPIVYGGFIALGVAADFYNKRYTLYRSELFNLLQDKNYRTINGVSEDQLRSAVNSSRRDRDYYMILTGLFYLIQILDAHIDAHLKEFDLNPELKVVIDPMFEQPDFAKYNAGISIKFKF
jgi:hypothetical protein